MMGSLQFDRIIRHIEATPGGITTGDLIEELKLVCLPGTLSSRMSKMFAYGKIGRMKFQLPNGRSIVKWTRKPIAGEGADITANKPLT